MAISSLQRSWQLDPEFRPRSVWFLASIRLARESGSMIVNDPKHAARNKRGRRGKGMRACGSPGTPIQEGNTIAEHGVKEWL
jgi:hypothetical protein